MMDLDLTGRRAIVTGASLGIGAATVEMLADHGASVAFCARNADAVELLSAYTPSSGEGSVSGYVTDMADADSVQSFLHASESDGGPADILVNNVGASPSRNFLYMTDEEWEQLHQLNLLSAVRCTRHCLPHMRGQKWGPGRDDRQRGRVLPGSGVDRLRGDEGGDGRHRKGPGPGSTEPTTSW